MNQVEHVDIEVGFDTTQAETALRGFSTKAKESLSKIGQGFNGKKVEKSAKEAGKGINKAFSGFSSRFSEALGSLKNIPGRVGQTAGQFQKMGKAMSGAGTIGKLALGGIIALVGVVLAKKIFDVSKQFGGMFDPVGNEKALSKMNESLRKMKTSIGAVLEPLFEIMAQVIGFIADGITELTTKFMGLVGFVQGILGLGRSVNQTLEDTADSMEEASESASAGLSGWDKLNSIDLQNEGDLDQAKKIQDTMNEAYALGADIRGGFLGFFDSLLPKEVKDAFGTIWNGFQSFGRTAWGVVSSIGQAVWGSLSDLASSTISAIGEGANIAFSWLSGALSSGFEVLADLGNTVWNLLSGAGGAILDGLKGMAQGLSALFEPVLNTVKWIADKVESIVNGVKSVTGGFLGSVMDAGSSFLGSIKIPGFASGTVAMPNNPHLAILGDNRREPEVVSPLSMMKQAVREVLAESSNGGSSGPSEIILKIDGKTLARYAYSDFRAEGRRRGDI